VRDLASVDLIELAKQNPAAVEKYTIRQIVGICGDGDLRDDSACSRHLREFLSLQSNDRLADYARFCLDEGFTKSGFVLQDTINEIGKRLGYEVQGGRYQGVVNQVGFDGLWFDGTNYIVVEVKTTDTYRINLDTISAYAEKLNASIGGAALKKYHLIVVGRQDTGDLEAQVRGSRHAWSTRLVSVDALIKLMFTKEEVEDKSLVERIRRILLPFEYTRVDHIVDLVFETQQETDQKAQSIIDPDVDDTTTGSEDRGDVAWEFTPRDALDAKRLEIVRAFFQHKNAKPIQITRTNFSDSTKQIGITCAVSKRYKREYQPYWYALHPKWLEFLQSVSEGFFILGCMDRNEAYVLPRTFIEENLEALNVTEKGDKKYWHVALTMDKGSLALNLSRIGKKISLAPYALNVSS
jgi:hypothetical protein